MTDDKPHEYVPQLAIYNAQALGEKIALMDSLEVAEAERNNLAEALRVVNARLVDVTAERNALREPLAQARMHQIKLEDCIEALKAERDEWKEAAAVRFDCCIELVKVKNERDEWKEAAEVRSDCCIELVKAENERDAARQSRKRAVWAANCWRASAEDWKECFHGVEETLTEAESDRDYYREALAKADVELTQLRAKMEDDGR